MGKETFHIKITEATRGRVYRPNILAEYDFESDNVFKDVAELISKENCFKYPNGLYFQITNNQGEEEKFWANNRGDTMFVKYCTNGYEGFDNSYTDWDAKPKYLTCLDEETNEYKYYLMTFDKNAENFNVQYGRIGMQAGEFHYQDGNYSKDGQYEYPAPMFWIKYYEKIAKGYEDKTELKDFGKTEMTVTKGEPIYEPIEEEETRNIFNHLIAMQRDAVLRSFDISVPFSQKAIELSKDILAQMNETVAKGASTAEKEQEFKKLYKELVVTLPRKIYDVNEYINRVDFKNHTSENFVANILNEEQELLDNFIDLYGKEAVKEEEKAVQGTVLDNNGLSAKVPDFKDKFLALDKMGDNAHKVSQVLEVTNARTKAAYESGKKQLGIKDKDCHLLWHGSRTENWWSIAKNGMSLNPNAIVTGKMFGNGLYFAPLAQKSMGYTDMRGSYWAGGSSQKGYLALFEVAMGRSYEPTHSLSSRFDVHDLHHGCDSVWAYPHKTGLRNEECIIYRENQCNLKYLVEIDSSRQREFSFDLKKARSIHLETPFCDEKTIVATCTDFGKQCNMPSVKMVQFEYDTDSQSMTILPASVESKLNASEKEYLTDVFMSNFADNKREFQRFAEEVVKNPDLLNDFEDKDKTRKKDDKSLG